VGFQPSSTWSAGAWTIVLIVTTLGVMLIVQTRARRRLDESLRKTRRFRMAVGDVLRAGPSGWSPVTDESRRRLADAMGVDEVWLWHIGDPADPAWLHATRRRDEAIASATIDELPRPLRQHLEARLPNVSVLVTPLDADGVEIGILCWISWRAQVAWSLDEIDRFKVLSTLVAGDLQRKRSGEALQRSHALKDAILSSLPARIAVLDRRGSIIAVNASWAEGVWPCSGNGRVEPGANFFELCRTAERSGYRRAADVAGVAAVCEGRRGDYEIEYPVTDADAERWFLMKTTPLQQEDGGAVVIHTDITVRKRAELVVRENEERFRRLADVLPVGVWMSDGEGARAYVNRTWIDITGRSMERQLGVGWLEAVHPDDRERCMGTYLRAFAKRAPFSMEYRIRRYDGEYRWLLDKGVPRYDVDTSFAGYLGGAIDFTDQRDAEQTLRQLSGKLIAAQEEERRRIARDLHDSVGQRMALVSIRLHDLRQRVSGPDDVSAILDHLWEDSELVASELHSLSHRLHSAKLDALGLVGAVASECREMSESGVLVQFSNDAVPPVSSDVGLCVFRIVQAALANVVKHSRATSAQVTMTGDRHVLVLTVQDGGVGFVADQRVEGLGLVSIRERVRSIGGELKVRSAPGQGTVIEARVPVKSGVPASNSVVNRSSYRFDNSPPPFLSDTSRTAPG
jgi:PAS domain S-box-containing protein